MTDSNPVWTPDLDDKFGDEIWDLKGAGIFSISLLGEKIRHECARSFRVMSRPAGTNEERWNSMRFDAANEILETCVSSLTPYDTSVFCPALRPSSLRRPSSPGTCCALGRRARPDPSPGATALCCQQS
ncbi:hypothetical protein AVEN_191436-1 [Araneus ventricosus]|uniref:Uncharacterized protein n=1 Tax=Araneus ventricosus TaxID=182803 RepID=A0A4Y1ZW37_ARAVE|nr:hypothetical protein AVEN_191436-1 [Araneus ventricosus]